MSSQPRGSQGRSANASSYASALVECHHSPEPAVRTSLLLLRRILIRTRLLIGTLLLLRRVLNELNPLLNIPLKPIIASLQQLLLVVVGGAEDVDGLDRALRAELDGHAEVVAAGRLLDRVAAVDAREVDEGGFHHARLALDGLHDALGEAEARVGHAEGGGAGAVFGFDYFVAAELDAWVMR